MATKNVIEGSNKVSASQLKDLFRQIDEGGITGDHIQAVLERRNPFDVNHESTLVSNKFNLYEVEVDGEKTLTELSLEGNFISDLDNIGGANGLRYFKILNKSKRKIQIKLFNFDNENNVFNEFTSQELIHKILEKGFQPITIEELLSLGIQYPYLITRYSIVALGSVGQFHGGFEFVSILSQGTNLITFRKKDKPTSKLSENWDPSLKFMFAGYQIAE